MCPLLTKRSEQLLASDENTLFTGYLCPRIRGNRMDTSIARFRSLARLLSRCAYGCSDSFFPLRTSPRRRLHRLVGVTARGGFFFPFFVTPSRSHPLLFLCLSPPRASSYPHVPSAAPSPATLSSRLLGSELVRIRPNRAVSSVGRERTSATRDAASSP